MREHILRLFEKDVIRKVSGPERRLTDTPYFDHLTKHCYGGG